MIDRSLLSRLPPPDLIRLASLHPLEAAAQFRIAARFCLDGARCVAFHDSEQERLAHRLIADGIALYALAFQRLESPQPRAVRIPATRRAANDIHEQPTPWDSRSPQQLASHLGLALPLTARGVADVHRLEVEALKHPNCV